MCLINVVVYHILKSCNPPGRHQKACLFQRLLSFVFLTKPKFGFQKGTSQQNLAKPPSILQQRGPKQATKTLLFVRQYSSVYKENILTRLRALEDTAIPRKCISKLQFVISVHEQERESCRMVWRIKPCTSRYVIIPLVRDLYRRINCYGSLWTFCQKKE